VAEAATTCACLDAAVAAAACGDDPVSIEALHVIVDPEKCSTASEEIQFQRLRERHEGTAQDRANAARAAFAGWTPRVSGTLPGIGWKELVGSEGEHVAREAARFDLLVMAQPHNMDGHDALHAAFFAAGRPLLLVPSHWTRPAAGFAARIAIAWNDTAAASRAVDGAMPWIRVAEMITIILIEEPEGIATALIERLNEENVATEVRMVKRSAGALGDQIVDEAHAAGADLLVMGAYRHSAFSEWLWGGTTRHALRHADLPLLLAH
jgi:nucleotide-binding universal stress UspA family protein